MAEAVSAYLLNGISLLVLVTAWVTYAGLRPRLRERSTGASESNPIFILITVTVVAVGLLLADPFLLSPLFVHGKLLLRKWMLEGALLQVAVFALYWLRAAASLAFTGRRPRLRMARAVWLVAVLLALVPTAFFSVHRVDNYQGREDPAWLDLIFRP